MKQRESCPFFASMKNRRKNRRTSPGSYAQEQIVDRSQEIAERYQRQIEIFLREGTPPDIQRAIRESLRSGDFLVNHHGDCSGINNPFFMEVSRRVIGMIIPDLQDRMSVDENFYTGKSPEAHSFL